MELDIKLFCRKHIRCLFWGSVIIIVISILVNTSLKNKLVITDSTHDELEFVEIGKRRLGTFEKIKFVVYDQSCDCIEICIAIPWNYNAMHYPTEMQFYVDGEKQEVYRYASRSFLGRNYVMILFDGVEEWKSMEIQHMKGVLEVYR